MRKTLSLIFLLLLITNVAFCAERYTLLSINGDSSIYYDNKELTKKKDVIDSWLLFTYPEGKTLGHTQFKIGEKKWRFVSVYTYDTNGKSINQAQYPDREFEEYAPNSVCEDIYIQLYKILSHSKE